MIIALIVCACVSLGLGVYSFSVARQHATASAPQFKDYAVAVFFLLNTLLVLFLIYYKSSHL